MTHTVIHLGELRISEYPGCSEASAGDVPGPTVSPSALYECKLHNPSRLGAMCRNDLAIGMTNAFVEGWKLSKNRVKQGSQATQ
jgi:hypothetical protein